MMLQYGWLIIIFWVIDVAVAADSLRFVQVLWRHGDRTPANPTFPTDTENTPEKWPGGSGQLTHIGVQQQRALGTYLRKRYIDTGFLSSVYNDSEIYIRSSDYNRTIQSAKANLAGFYGSSDVASAIHIHVISRSEDYLLNVERACPEAKRLLAEELQSEFVRTKEAENKEFMRFLSNATGLRVRSFTQLSRVFDPLNCERFHNRTWPSWVTPDVFERIKALHYLASTIGADNPKIHRLKGGPLYGELIRRSERKAKGSVHPPSLKYYVYSGHDLTIAALLKNMGAYDGRVPSYASALIFELHEKDTNQFVMKVLYINETGSENPAPITVKGCGGPECDLSTIVALARRNTPVNWYAECGLDK